MEATEDRSETRGAERGVGRQTETEVHRGGTHRDTGLEARREQISVSLP